MLPTPAPRSPVPWRTIWAVIGSVVLTGFAFMALTHLTRILTWLAVAVFFAVVLSPPVDFLVRRARFSRGLATMTVFLVGIALVGALMYAFIRPLVDESQDAIDNFPEYVADARAGRGPIGDLVTRYDLDERLEQNQDRIREEVNQLGSNSLKIIAGVGNAVAAVLTILVLAILMILEGPKMLRGFLNALEPPRRERVARVAGDAAKAVTGYVAGNLLISLVAGVTAFVWLLSWGVPFAGVLALWVAFADLIPLVGATLGAIPAVAVAFIHSPLTGFATIGFYVVYQQFENHVLQVTIMSRTVKLNPLMVLVSVLVGVEVFGLLGALLAIPVAGIIQVVGRDIWDEHKGEFKDVPTVGADETPISAAPEGA